MGAAGAPGQLGRAGSSGKMLAENARLLLPSQVRRQHSGGDEKTECLDHSVKSACFNFLQPDFGPGGQERPELLFRSCEARPL